MVLEFVESQRGKPKLNPEGYLCCLLREKDGLKTWRCDKRQRQCKAIATTFEDNVFTTREHLHEPDMKHLEQLKVFGKDERENREFKRAAKKNCSRYNSNNYAWVCSVRQNSCGICARSRASLKTALQEYAREQFCQSMPKWSVTASVFSNFSTIIKTLICCLFKKDFHLILIFECKWNVTATSFFLRVKMCSRFDSINWAPRITGKYT